MGTFAVTIAERLKVSATDALFRRVPADLGELVVVAPVQRRQWRLKGVLRDALRVSARGRAGAISRVALVSAFGIAGRITTTLPVTLRSGVRVGLSSLAKQGVTIAERVLVRPTLQGPTTYRKAVTSRVRLTDHLPNMKLGAALRDVLRYGATALGLRRVVTTVRDRIEVDDVLTSKLQLIVFQTDGVELTDGTLLRAVYNGVLSDTVDFIIDVVDPGGDTTTWAMNVRTGAVTEYLNYAFNSFTRSANGTYLAAGADGLYELAGDDDDDGAVVATLTGGLVDFSGPYLSGLQAVYLGLRGQGEFFLRLTQGDGRSVTYEVRVQSLKTARVNVGKGLRATYFTWELMSTGQDFDLLGIDFLPIQSQRRI